MDDEKAFRELFQRLVRDGKYVSPRGQLVLEAENFSFELPPYCRFQSFACRKLSLDYIRDEFLWYLNADRFDLSICARAKIWKGIVNEDGSLNSNYGQYIFGKGGQFEAVVNFLKNDRDSRRASMMILSRDHVLSKTNDLPCTYALNFRIRENRLNMSVHMRSQDAIFGMGNDVPTFSFIHEMMLNTLREFYPDLEYGSYFHIADSFHVYERHFKMLSELTGRDVGRGEIFRSRTDVPLSPYERVECPPISGPEEAHAIVSLPFALSVCFQGQPVIKSVDDIDDSFKFCKWLVEPRLKREAAEESRPKEQPKAV